MPISINDKLPDANLLSLGQEGPESVDLGELSRGRCVVIFAVPGAFTPTCHNTHMPGFVDNADKFRACGADEIICITVNDPFVTNTWSEQTGAAESGVRVLADADGAFTRELGLGFSAPPAGLHDRSKRYSLIAVDGTVRVLNVEDNPGVCEVSSGAELLDQLKGLNAGG